MLKIVRLIHVHFYLQVIPSPKWR